MKRVIVFLMGVFVFLSGCSLLSEKEEIKLTAENNNQRVIPDLSAKGFELEVRLVDARDKKVVKTLSPLSYEDEHKYVEDVKNIAKELASGIDKPMIPAKIGANGELIPGKSRVVLEESALVEELSKVSIFDKEITLPITETTPNITTEAIAGLDEKVLGSYTTRFNPSARSRNINIGLSAKEINNIVLGPGDRFYFNSIVGDSTPDKGYQLATVIVNKEFVEGYGGGVCQTSTTLYNAVENAGLDIIELHHHSKSVGYVPQGRDATIAYGYKDFKFVNNKDYPVIIKTIFDERNGKLEVRVTSSGKYVASN